ncbi:hypothetical protein ILYODFUR_012805 [Ilyodon furcidens]|uniref:Uncharacterized protein n=1 Tax=Ilyodon furcidens TaxID=33524 RepID=A0ABV0URI5_9TELE
MFQITPPLAATTNHEALLSLLVPYDCSFPGNACSQRAEFGDETTESIKKICLTELMRGLTIQFLPSARQYVYLFCVKLCTFPALPLHNLDVCSAILNNFP